MLTQDQLTLTIDSYLTDDQLESLADRLQALAQEPDCREIDADGDTVGLDYRLYLRPNGDLELNIGSSDYDTDHRGFCVSGWVDPDWSWNELMESVAEVMEDLWEEVVYPA